MLRCSKCGLLLSYPNAYSGNSVCSYCTVFKRKKFLGKELLLERLNNEKRIGVTVSGGKDSIFVWNWLVKSFGSKKVIALNHNKVGAVHSIAGKNIQSAKKKLKSKVIIVDDFEFYPRFIENISNYIKKPNAAILRAVLCSGCRYGISNRLFEEALKYDIHTVVNGSSYLELAPFKGYFMEKYGNGCDTAGLLKGLSENSGYLSQSNLLAIIKDHYNCHIKDLSNKMNKYGINYIDFFDYFENKPDEIRQTVIKDLNWSFPETTDWHFDCIVEDFKQYFYLLEYGFSELDFKYSEMVRYELISRENAIKKLEENNTRIRNSTDDLKLKLASYKIDDNIINLFSGLSKAETRDLT